jgi:endonuclease/exonuclease/phosphatase family metal-dependent hydrolase
VSTRRLRLLSANIQAGSSTRGYHDYVARSWSHVLPAGNKRGALDTIAQLAARHDIVGLQESDPGSLRSGFTNQTHYLAERGGFAYWSHQPNRSMGGVASSANGLLSRLEPMSVADHPLPGRISGRGVLLARFGSDDDALTIAVAHLSLGAN